MTIELLNGDNIAPNTHVNVWWDNVDMTGDPDGSADAYQPGYGSQYSHITLFVNWGATYPDSDMGIDLDDIEIWEGIPE